ncbi:hypothetical protein [Thermostichus sp. OS-CIW-28]
MLTDSVGLILSNRQGSRLPQRTGYFLKDAPNPAHNPGECRQSGSLSSQLEGSLMGFSYSSRQLLAPLKMGSFH